MLLIEYKKQLFSNFCRFVVLEDCGHCVESEELDDYLKIQRDIDGGDGNEDEQIFLKTCPICSTPINKTKRYMNEVKLYYEQLVKIKGKVKNDGAELRKQSELFVTRLKLLYDILPGKFICTD